MHSSGRLFIATPLVWTNRNRDAARNFSRYTPKLVTWTGGDPNGFVTISGQSATNGTANAVGAAFTCTAKNTDGQFTIPDYILSALPITGNARQSVKTDPALNSEGVEALFGARAFSSAPRRTSE